MKKLLRTLVCLFACIVSISGVSVAQPTWTSTYLGSGYADGVGGIYFLNATTGFAVGTQGAIFRTTNAGASFVKVDCPVSLYLGCINFINQTTGYVAGENGTVIKTTDGGLSWNVVVIGLTSRTFFNITFRGTEINFSGGLGTIFKTTNNGNNWIDQSLGVNGNFYGGIAFLPGNKRLVVCNSAAAAIWTSTNGGANWNGEALPDNAQAVGQYWLDSLTGYVIGNTTNNTVQVVYKTTNGGFQWTKYILPGAIYTKAITFVNNTTGFILTSQSIPSSKGQIYWTTNAGQSWSLIKEYENTALLTITSFGTKVYIGATSGQIISGDVSVQINPISTTVPSVFSLSQNFPNPFNPTTKIRFTIPTATQGRLTIYNMQGQEVKTITNQFFAAGTYEPEFNASGLSSGTYFYRLETEGFSQTKKMILVK